VFDTLHRELELVERTLGILLLVSEHGPIGIRRLSRIAEKEHHEIHSSLRVLEEEGYIESTPDGATTTLEAQTFLAEMDDDIDGITAHIDSLSTRVSVPTRVEH
jgi:predicted transcriptional regulator